MRSLPTEPHSIFGDDSGFDLLGSFSLEDLAFVRGVLVMDGRLDGAEARLVRKGNKGIARISNSIFEPGRRRFAIAHELGHWELHANLSQITVCTYDDMLSRYKTGPSEIEANIFASELLMPRRLFEPRVSKANPSFGLIKQLADDFQTTLTATSLRLAELTTVPCVFVFSENGRIKWWRGSPDFRNWLEPGSSLSPKSVAASYFNGEDVPADRQEVDYDAWFDSSDQDEPCVTEEVAVLSRYGQVISLITL